MSRRTLLANETAFGAVLLMGKTAFGAGSGAAGGTVVPGASSDNVPNLSVNTFSSPRHTTRYLEAGPIDGPLMIFLHGWPQIGLMWRAQIEAFASDGWRCVAPDMRGYGGSSAPTTSDAYALKELVDDMVELHDHLGARPAV